MRTCNLKQNGADLASRPRPSVADIEKRDAKMLEDLEMFLMIAAGYALFLYCGLNPL